MQTSVESAEAHYKAVIRAYVTEALELSQFLDTVAADRKLQASQREIAGSDSNKQNSMSVQNLDTLDLIDWVRFQSFQCNMIHTADYTIIETLSFILYCIVPHSY